MCGYFRAVLTFQNAPGRDDAPKHFTMTRVNMVNGSIGDGTVFARVNGENAGSPASGGLQPRDFR
jgi:hypothetical protein